MNNIEVFRNEIDLIEDEQIKALVIKALESAPDYFYTIPASATGKYHPAYSLGEGGLVRHTKAAVKLANDLLTLELYAKLVPHRDEIIAALILHDSVKKGINGNKFTTIDHPLEASKLVRECANKSYLGESVHVDNICNNIESHMGQWNKDRSGNEIMPKPRTLEQKFVHLCDYLASRRYITIELP